MPENNGIFSLNLPTHHFSTQSKEWLDYPDTFSYSFSRETYQRYWSELSQRSGYLMTVDTFVIRVNWFQMSWEKIKGWFGFTDHCEQNRVQLALRKTLYFGYLHQLNRQIEVADELNIPNGFLTTCRQEKNNTNSLFLQQNLIDFFNSNVSSHPRFFGESYFERNNSGQKKVFCDHNANTLIEIDPQAQGTPNKLLIDFFSSKHHYKKVYELIEGYGFNSEELRFNYYNDYLLLDISHATPIKERPLVFNRWIDYLFDSLRTNRISHPDKIKTAITLIYQIRGTQKIPDKFVWLALRHDCRDIAMNWIEVLTQTDSQAALKWVAENRLVDLLVPDSELAVLYAKKILPTTAGKFLAALYNFIQRPTIDNKSLYQEANRLDTSLRLTLKPVANAHLSQLIEASSWNEAIEFCDTLRKTNPSIQLYKTSLDCLALQLNQCGLEMHDEAEQLKANIEEQDEAMKLYEGSIAAFIDSKKFHDTEDCRENLNNSCYAIIDLLLSQQRIEQQKYSAANEYMKLIEVNRVTKKSTLYEPTIIRLREYAAKLAGSPFSSTSQTAEKSSRPTYNYGMV